LVSGISRAAYRSRRLSLNPNTAYSIELNAATEIPEWKKSIRIMLEEDGFWNGKQFSISVEAERDLPDSKKKVKFRRVDRFFFPT
jgi:ubiquitin-protein ligase